MSDAHSHSSFKEFVESDHHGGSGGDIESGRFGADRNPQAMDGFNQEVDNVKEDIEQMEKLYISLVESSDQMKAASSAKILMDLRTRTNMSLDQILKMARQINKKFDGLILTNAAQRKNVANGDGSDDDQARSSMISALGESLKDMMVKFQALRIRMETDHRQIIESRFFSITGEKATEDAIENLAANSDLDDLLFESIQEHGKGTVLDAVAEIQERRDAMKETRRNLMNLHQILLGMATPMEIPARGATNHVDTRQVTQANVAAAATKTANGLKKLNDYEKETRNQAYIALAVALVFSMIIISLYLKFESIQDEDWTLDPGAPPKKA